jgi:hypothetical protein
LGLNATLDSGFSGDLSGGENYMWSISSWFSTQSNLDQLMPFREEAAKSWLRHNLPVARCGTDWRQRA